MEKTAIEQLELSLLGLISFDSEELRAKYKERIAKAKETFEKQIIDACNQTEFEDIDGMGIHETITKGEQYYEEVFKKKK